MRHQSLHIFNLSVARIVVAALLVLGVFPGRVRAQQNNDAAASTIPQIIQFSGTLGGASAPVPSGTISITFTLYENEQGGTALWSETDNVQLDAQGHYTALLGSASPQGLPLNLFTAVQARWLAVQPLLQGFAEQPRVLLVSAPYALKAGDAQTLGGLPASAFLQAAPVAGAAASSAANAQTQEAASGLALNAPPSGCTAITSAAGGTANKVAKFDAACDIINSAIFESGGRVGIGTITPAANLDLRGTADMGGALTMESLGTATATKGFNSNPLDLLGSSFNSTNRTAISQHFRWQAEPVGNDTANNSGSLNLLYAAGTGIPAETGLSVSSKGLFTFAAGQTFPGTGNGTITGVIAGTDLTGGGSSGAVTLNLDTTYVPTLGAASNVFTGSITAASFTGSGAAVTGVNAALLNGLASSAFQPAGSYATLGTNTFTGDQTINGTGNLTASGTVTGAVVNATTRFDLGGIVFASGSASLQNAFLGFAGNTTATGGANTASGYQALFSTTTGNLNTASGFKALFSNTTGGSNTSSGYEALQSNTTGSNNTASGWGALFDNNGNNNTASGYQALFSNTTGAGNTASGYQAIFSNTTGGSNTASGYLALLNNTTGGNNTATGTDTLYGNTTGSNNVAIGYGAASGVSGGNSNNIHVGNQGSSGDSGVIRIGTVGTQTSSYIAGIAGVTLPSGNEPLVCVDAPTGQLGTLNCASGGGTITGVTAGTDLTGGGTSGIVTLNADTTKLVTGVAAGAGLSGGGTGGSLTLSLASNVCGAGNALIALPFACSPFATLAANTFGGDQSITGNITASGTMTGAVVNATTSFDLGGTAFAFGSSSAGNAFLGFAGNTTNTGSDNTASGPAALASNTTGSINTATGYEALYNNTTGFGNVAIGAQALYSNATGSNNIAIGAAAGTFVSGGSGNIEIGNGGSFADNDVIRIGDSSQTSFFAAGVRAVTTGNNDAVPVLIDSNGQLGTVSSSRRFKEDIHDMGGASEGLMRLRPVTFRYKKPFYDGSKPIQYGLIAEEVAEVYPDLVARSADGQIETVKYQLLDPMLLNEVQRQQKEVQRQDALIQQQSAQLVAQQAQIRELASQVKLIQASLQSRHKAARATLASARSKTASGGK